MAQLDWLVVRDLAMIETATFWKDAPEIETGEIVPEDCRTEVFFFPAASHVEKEGTFTQTERMLQWREQAVEPAGDQRSDLWFTYHLGRLIRERLAGSADERDRPILELNWDLPVHGDPVWGEPDAEEVLRRINGYHLDTGELVGDYRDLRADGSTSSGCWIYSGVFKGGVNLSARRGDGPDGKWGWCWPLDRRVLYNRASADPAGQAVERAQEARLVGRGRPALGGRRHPRLPRRPAARPRAAAGRGRRPPRCAATTRSCSRPTGRRGCSRPTGVVDGPLPTHYEPDESPVRNRAARAAGEPDPHGGTDTGTTRPTPRQSEVFPYRAHLVPAHRALHVGGHDAHAAVPGRAAARAVRRGVAAAGRTARADARAVVPRRHEPHGGAGARGRHRTDPAAAGAGPGGAPGVDALPLRHARAGARRRHERPARHRRRPERGYPGGQGGDLRRPAGPAPHRQALLDYVADYRRRAGMA